MRLSSARIVATALALVAFSCACTRTVAIKDAHHVSGGAEPVRCAVAESLTAARTGPVSQTEIRLGARLVHMFAPRGDADFIGSGLGSALGIVYHSDFDWAFDGELMTEVIFGHCMHEEPSDASGLSRFALAGFRWLDRYGGRLETYLSMGGGYYSFEVSGGQALVGGGAYLGCGAELILGRAASACADVAIHRVWGEERAPGMGDAVMLSASLNIRF